MRRLLNTFILWLGLLSAAWAQMGAPDLYMQKLSAEDGLFSNRYFKSFRDSKGQLWITGINGVARYDGNLVQNYTPFADTSQAFINGIRFYTITEDNKGQVWIGADSGLHLFRSGENKFEQVHKGAISNIRYLYMESDSLLGISCYGRQNYWVNISNGEIAKQRRGVCVLNQITDAQGNEWRSTDAGHIIRNRKDTLLQINQAIEDICFTSNGRLFMATLNGLYYCNINASEPKVTHLTDRSSALALTSNSVTSVAYFDGYLWVATQMGLNRFVLDSKGAPKEVQHFYTEPGNRFSVCNNRVNDVFVDHEGILWISTHGGLGKIDREQTLLKALKNDPKQSNSLHDNNVFPIVGDTLGNVWFGSYQSGASKLNSKTGTFEWLNAHNGYDIKSVNYIAKDAQERIWIVADRRLLMHWGDRLHEIKVIDASGSAMSSGNITAIEQHPDRSYWLGMNGNLVEARLTDQNQLQIIRTAVKNCGNILRLYIDAFQRIWAGTNAKGLLYLDPEIPLSAYFYHKKNHAELRSPTFQAIQEDSEGNLWLGTMNGLYCLTNDSLFRTAPQNARLKSYFREDGLTHDYITGMLPELNGVLWISSWKGMLKYDPANISECRFTPYTPADGVIADKYNRHAVYLDRGNNTYYFGSVNGVTYFTPQPEVEARDLPQVLVNSVRIDGEEILSAKTQAGDAIVSDNRIETLEVSWGSSSQHAPDKQVFAWQLEGHDSIWTFQRGHSVALSNIPAGNYVLNICAASPKGKMGEPVSIPIEVKNRWRAFAFIVAILGFLLGVMFYLKRKQKKSEETEEKNKYVFSKLTTDSFAEAAQRLEKLMQDEKPFLSPELTADKLAKLAGVSSGELSQILNEYLNTKFYSYINKYRVEEFVALLDTPEAQKLTLTALSEKCGFTSKSTFYRAFNAEKGMTPAQYAKGLKS